MRNPRCPVCRNRLNDDGTCRFASSHENILRTRAENARQDSERKQGRGRSAEDMKQMSDKAARVRRGMKRPEKAKNAARSDAAKKRGIPARDSKGRFRKRKNGK